MAARFKELTIEDIVKGYALSEKGVYTCIFCGETFEEGLVYDRGGRLLTAERAMREHVESAHGGVFYGLLDLDKQISGISDAQKDVLEGMYLGKSSKDIGEELGIGASTVRTHKFNIQRMKREARILLSLLAQIENESVVAERRQLRESMADAGEAADGARDRAEEERTGTERSLTANNLHPFFTQFNLK